MVTSPGQQIGPTRYEHILAASTADGDLGRRLAAASRAARSAVPAASEHEQAIRDVAAGVAAPALAGCAAWMLREATARGAARLCFLSRDGQVLYEMARRLAPCLGVNLDLEYAYSSRLTWSLAATNPGQLPQAAWLFNSFIKSNAADLCARLGLPADQCRHELLAVGASLNPEVRADDPRQANALRRFLTAPAVTTATASRISETRQLVLDYAAQHQLTGPATALADAGWTGRMIGSLIQVCEQAGMQRPHILLWGHEPRPDGWTDPDHVAAYMYNTATGHGTNWRVPDAPFLVETFCMADHGIANRYARTPPGTSSQSSPHRTTPPPAPGACPYTAPPSTHPAPPSPRKGKSLTPTSGPQSGRS